MTKKIIKDSFEFVLVFVILSIVFDLFRNKNFDGHYFLNLFGKSIFTAIIFGVVVIVFKKKYQRYSGGDE